MLFPEIVGMTNKEKSRNLQLNRLLKYQMKAFVSVTLIIFSIFLFTAAPQNLWFLINDDSYMIPEESSLYSFEPTQLKDKTESRWIYGKDGERFYYRKDTDVHYYIISKAAADSCRNFNQFDISTWCFDYVSSSR
jgi:hypothetical protein